MSESSGFDLSKVMDRIKGDRNLMILTIGAVVAVVGLFLPWYTITFSFGGLFEGLGGSAADSSTSVSPGLDGPGLRILIAAVVAVGAALNVFNQDKNIMSYVVIGAAVLSTLFVVAEWPDSDLGDVVDTGLGYWLSLAGSVAMIVGGVMMRKGSMTKSSPKASSGGDANPA